MKFRLTALALALVMGALILTPLSGAAAAQAANPLKNIPVTGAAGATQAFTGTLDINNFSHKGNQILANGTLKGTLTKADGTTAAIEQAVSLPVNVADGTCEILNLTLGPLDLNLLGLRVQLNQINLRISAEQGSGNLLGNLLCQVSKLLDNPGRNVGRLVNLLNQILGAVA